MAVKTLDLLIRAEQQIDRAMGPARKAIDAFNKTVGNTHTVAEKARSTVQKLVGAYLGFQALRQVKNWIMGATEAAGVQEDAEKRLIDALKLKGIYTRETSKDLKKYASGLQQVTKYGDETILSVEEQLVRYGMQGKQLKEMTKLTLDFAAGKKIDLMSATDLLGKAFLGETSALSRYGIVIDKNIPKAQKMAVVQQQLNEKYGGAAEAEAKTYTGILGQMKNAYSDLQEQIGFIITQSPEMLSFLENLKERFAKAIKVIEKNREQYAQYVGAIIDKLPGAIDAIINFTRFLIDHADAIVSVGIAWGTWKVISKTMLLAQGLTAALSAVGMVAPAAVAAIGTFAGPIAIIAALSAAVIYFIRNNEKVAEVTGWVVYTMHKAWERFKEAMLITWTTITEKAQVAWLNIKQAAVGTLVSIIEKIQSLPVIGRFLGLTDFDDTVLLKIQQEYADIGEGIDTVIAKSNMKREAIRENARKEIERINQAREAHDKEAEAAKNSVTDHQQAAKDKIAASKDHRDAAIKDIGDISDGDKKALKEREKAQEKFSQIYRKATTDQYDLALAKLYEEKEYFEKMGIDKVKLEEWFTAERQKLLDKQTKDAIKAAEKEAKEKKRIQEKHAREMERIDDYILEQTSGREAVELENHRRKLREMQDMLREALDKNQITYEQYQRSKEDLDRAASKEEKRLMEDVSRKQEEESRKRLRDLTDFSGEGARRLKEVFFDVFEGNLNQAGIKVRDWAGLIITESTRGGKGGIASLITEYFDKFDTETDGATDRTKQFSEDFMGLIGDLALAAFNTWVLQYFDPFDLKIEEQWLTAQTFADGFGEVMDNASGDSFDIFKSNFFDPMAGQFISLLAQTAGFVATWNAVMGQARGFNVSIGPGGVSTGGFGSTDIGEIVERGGSALSGGFGGWQAGVALGSTGVGAAAAVLAAFAGYFSPEIRGFFGDLFGGIFGSEPSENKVRTGLLKQALDNMESALKAGDLYQATTHMREIAGNYLHSQSVRKAVQGYAGDTGDNAMEAIWEHVRGVEAAGRDAFLASPDFPHLLNALWDFSAATLGAGAYNPVVGQMNEIFLSYAKTLVAQTGLWHTYAGRASYEQLVKAGLVPGAHEALGEAGVVPFTGYKYLPWPAFHGGGMFLGADEGLAILHYGEGILTPRGVSRLGGPWAVDAINQGYGPTQPRPRNYYINVDARESVISDDQAIRKLTRKIRDELKRLDNDTFN